MKFSRHMWVKCLATILGILSLIGAIGSLGFLLVDSQVGSRKEIKEELYASVYNCYGVNLLECASYTSDETQRKEELDNLAAQLDPRYHFAIIQSDKADSQEAIAEMKQSEFANLLYGTPEDALLYQEVTMGSDAATYSFSSFDSLMSMIKNSNYAYHVDGKSFGEEVNCVWYVIENGIFYYDTDSGCYPVHQVLIYTDENTYTAYSLVENEDKSLSYVSDSGEVLTQNYENWYAVRLENEQCAQRTMVSNEAWSDSQTAVDSNEDTIDITEVPFSEAVEMEDMAAENFAPGICVFVTSQVANGYILHGLENTYIENGLLWHEEMPITYYYVLAYIDAAGSNTGAKDEIFDEIDHLWGLYESIADAAIWIEILCVLVFIVCLIILFAGVGKRPEDEEVHLSWYDRVWGEVIILVDLAIGALLGMGMVAILDSWNGKVLEFFIIELQLAIGMAFICASFLVTVIVRIKAKKFIRYTFLYWILHYIKRFFGNIHQKISDFREKLHQNTNLTRRTVWALLAGTFVVFISFLFCCVVLGYESAGWMVFWFMVMALLVWIVVLSVVHQMDILAQASLRIANGDLTTPIDEQKLKGPFKEGARRMNHIQDGIQMAVEKQMKSERFKTELITNVSHDIKTPLTSIINYVDLMKKQDITDPTMQEYMDVLDRQSNRLKKLIEDLMEASKASTGNLQVNFETCDARVLLTQVVGEFEEKLEKAGLNLVIDSQETPVYIRVDGRHMWRVFENLLNNICKYAQPDTRVYVSLAQDDKNVQIIFRNVSKYQLNISGEELMERFVRGDSSRNTEGSGLGLSIAQSLMALMNGKMEIYVDGDLFKVILKFPIETKV